VSRTQDRQEDWRQRVVTFHNHQAVEPALVSHLGPGMKNAETAGLLAGWFFVRKGENLRLRYLPTDPSHPGTADAYVEHLLDDAQRPVSLVRWATTIYEPEVYAFGGPAGIEVAHELFHRDSQEVLEYLAEADGDISGKRREMSVLLCSALFRSAGQEWFEQGDVWARVAATRPADDGAPAAPVPALANALKRLMMVDTGPDSSLVNGGSLEFARDWIAAFEEAGNALSNLAGSGILTRGLRAVLAHHVIFHWNRLGLPAAVQGRMAATAREVVLGD
jgi:protein-L-isoaspartate(D-aspartate) O-methyltransferase